MDKVNLMNATNEIGFDGLPRFRTETRRCYGCGADFSLTWDRHSLDDGARTCEACRDLPTYSVEIRATDPDGRRITILPHHPTMLAGQRFEWHRTPATIRIWIEVAKAQGCTAITLGYKRHTARRGTHERRVRVA